MVARDAQARILAVAPLPLPYFSVLLEVSADYAEVAAGQFVMIETRPGLEPYLRRAFSVHDVSSGPAGVRIELLGKVVGRGTRALAEARAGETRALLGPLGRPFSAPPAGARVALVAGGVGSAPLYLLARELAARGAAFDLYYGGRTAHDLPRREDFRALLESAGGTLVEVTEDGSLRRARPRHRAARGRARGRPLRLHLLLRADAHARAPGRGERRGRRRRRGGARDRDGMRLRRLSRLRGVPRLRALRALLQGRTGLPSRRGALVSAAPSLAVRLGPLELPNPILTASGTFGYGLEFEHLAALDRLGGIVTKGLSLTPLAGNPPPRVGETRGGMLNSIGLQNIGVERFLAEVLPGLGRFPARVVVNLFGYELDDYARLAARVDSCAGIAAVELNVSCPNVKKGGIQFGHDPEVLERLVRSVRGATGKPLIVKLSPNATDPALLGEAARAGGADILSAINTVLGMSIDPWTRRPRLRRQAAGSPVRRSSRSPCASSSTSRGESACR